MKGKAIFLMIICTFFTAFAQIFYKYASLSFDLSFAGLVANKFLILGFLFYGTALVFMMLAYRLGDLTAMYPLMASSYVWVVLLAPVFFVDEIVTSSSLFGVVLIVVGIVLVERGAE